jgi:hypothetical protein
MLGDGVDLSDMGRRIKGVMAARALNPKRLKVRGARPSGFVRAAGRVRPAGRVRVRPGQRFQPRYSRATNPNRGFVPGEGAALAERHYGVGHTPTMEDYGLGKKKGFFGRLGKNIKGGIKVAGGVVGFKKGLTASQLKKSGIIRKVGLVVGAVAGAAVFGPAILAKAGSLAKMGVGKFGKLFGAFSKARKDAGLPPVTAETFAGAISQGQESAAAAGAAPSEAEVVQAASQRIETAMATQPGMVAREAVAFERSLVTPAAAAEQAAALPPAIRAAATEAASDVAEAALPGGGMSTMTKVAIGGGVAAGVGLLYYFSTRKRGR